MTDPATKTAYQRLTPAQRRFVDMIVQGSTGTDAIRKLRPKAIRPDGLATKWKALPVVRDAIDQRLADAMEEAGVESARILLKIANILNVSPKSLVWLEGEKEGVTAGTLKKLHELDDVTARCIQSFKVSDGDLEIRFPDKLTAAKYLGQYKRLFTESHEINLGEKTLEQLVEASWGRPKPPGDDTPPAAGL